MVGHRHSAAAQRANWTEGDFSEIATISIASDDLEATRRFYGETLGLKALSDVKPEPGFIEGVSRLTGTPQGGGVHWISYAHPEDTSGKILMLHFAGAGGKRLTGRMRPGHLGFSLLSHRAADPKAAAQKTADAGFAVFTPPTVVEIAGQRREIVIIQGPNEELLELVGDPL